MKGHRRAIWSIDFSPNGCFLISGSDDRSARIWNIRDGSSVILGDSQSAIVSVRVSPDGKSVAAGNKRGEVLVWNLRSGHLVALLKGHTDIVDGIAFMPNGEGLVTSSFDGALNHWDIDKSTLLAQISRGRGREVAVDDEKKERLTFVAHTVVPLL